MTLGAMNLGNKIWLKMENKLNSAHIKKIMVQAKLFEPHNEKYVKVLKLGGFWPPALWK
jgi:hypothetical protein